MTIRTAGTTVTRHRSRVAALLVMGAAILAPLAAQADEHHPPVHHRHQVCHNVRVSDHHGHYHNTRQCHWVNR